MNRVEKTDRLMELEREAVAFQTRMNALGIALTAVFGGFEGESYADIPTVVRTVGLVPLETRALRLRQMKSIADFSHRFWQCNVVALHLGFVPHDPADPQYREVINFTRDLCNHCRANGQALHLETGQEPADVLLRFIQNVERDNLFINFDPANMIMYGVGEPIAALETLAPYVRSVHCKDAKWAAQPGQEWGREVPLGQGDVDMEAFFAHAQENRLRRPVDDRTRTLAGPGAATNRSCTGDFCVEWLEAEDPGMMSAKPQAVGSPRRADTPAPT